MLKKIIIALLVILVVLQLVPKPTPNVSTTASVNDITSAHTVPQDVQQVLKTSCYDCHSNNTTYPWYSKVQPVAWWLGRHVSEGKQGVNFSEFAGYRPYRQYHKLEEIAEQVEEGEMPLSSYTLIHTDAKLSDAQKSSIVSWAKAAMDSMKAKYPADSLVRPKKK